MLILKLCRKINALPMLLVMTILFYVVTIFQGYMDWQLWYLIR